MISILILLSILLVVIIFIQLASCHQEGMVELGTDLSATVDIDGATYGKDGNQGVGIDPPAGYTKINVGTEAVPIFKMKPIIPDGFKISSNDSKVLVPIKETTQQSLIYYQNSTDKLLNQPPYLDITDVDYTTGEDKIGEEAPLPTTDKDLNGKTKVYYRIKVTAPDGKIKYVMKQMPDPIPKGYQLGKNNISDKTSDFLVFNPTLYALSTLDSNYNASDIDTPIRDTDTDLSEAPDSNLGVYYQFDQNGNMVKIENTEAQFSPVLYYIPGAYKFGSSNYVPNYEDSVYLSRTTRQSQVTPVYNTASILGGFCTQDNNDVATIEEKCGALDLDTCASTSCCTLLGGQKCVAGNQNGPRNIANYSDYNLKNKDFYYYQGKCYGNCQK